MLKIRNLNVSGILNNINLDIPSGALCGIFGSSGSGKSTLLHSIKNFKDNWSGSIQFNGENIDKYNRKIGYIFQETILYSHMSLLENLRLTDVEEMVIYKKLKEMSIDHLIDKTPLQLSGGEKQRIGICRTLLMEPQLLLMDEPTSALDTVNKNFIYDYIQKLNREQKITFVIISHDEHSKYLFNIIYKMSKNKIERIK